MEEETPKAKKRSSVLGSLREAIAKVRFLLSFSATRWMLLRSLTGRGGGVPKRRLSFDARPGLLDVDDSILASPASSSTSTSSSSRTSRSASLGTASARTLSRASSAAASPEALMKRAASSSASSGGGGSSPAAAAGDDDIDRRAELFIENFYRQLRMERQVSLQLRYVRGNSWDRTPAASPSPSRG